MLASTCLTRIQQLGGTCEEPGGSLLEVFASISFPRPLHTTLGLDGFVSLPDVHHFVTHHAALRSDDPTAWEAEVWRFVSQDWGIRFREKPYVITPEGFPGTDDIDFVVRGQEIEPLEFVHFSDGSYPDTQMVYLHDSDPSDPLVYFTDHETMWQDMYSQPLSAFLDELQTFDQIVAILDADAQRWADIQAKKSEDA